MRCFQSAAVLVLVTCVVSAGDEPSAIDQAVSSSYGGQTESDEPPAFGDSELLSAAFAAVNPKVNDPVGGRNLRHAERVRVAIAWGAFPPQPDAEQVVDWGGSITVENAALRVIRTLRFEDTGLILRPRTDIHAVEFESQTKPFADGILVDVVLAPSLNPSNRPVTLAFSTAPWTETLTIAPDVRGTRVIPVDGAGHVVVYRIIRPNTDGCAEGFVTGLRRTSRTADGREVGVLKGRIDTDDGRLRGYLRGVFGQRRNGAQVWFAKMIDDEGTFRGIVAGRYGEGRLGGLIIAPNGKVEGVVHARYTEDDGVHDTAFLGRSSLRCGEDSRERMRITTDEPPIQFE